MFSRMYNKGLTLVKDHLLVSMGVILTVGFILGVVL